MAGRGPDAIAWVSLKQLRLVPVGDGALALTGRPKRKELWKLRELGVTHLVTLLAEHEGARAIGEAAEETGLYWFWVPFEGAGVPSAMRGAELRRVFEELRQALADGARIVVHCSAGIHRTGMFTYALLRALPLDKESARAKLRELRKLTADGVGEDRMAWGDALADEVADPSML